MLLLTLVIISIILFFGNIVFMVAREYKHMNNKKAYESLPIEAFDD